MGYCMYGWESGWLMLNQIFVLFLDWYLTQIHSTFVVSVILSFEELGFILSGELNEVSVVKHFDCGFWKNKNMSINQLFSLHSHHFFYFICLIHLLTNAAVLQVSCSSCCLTDDALPHSPHKCCTSMSEVSLMGCLVNVLADLRFWCWWMCSGKPRCVFLTMQNKTKQTPLKAV